jgi:hypothetical protein
MTFSLMHGRRPRSFPGPALVAIGVLLWPVGAIATIVDVSGWTNEGACDATFSETSWTIESTTSVLKPDNNNCASFFRGGLAAQDQHLQFDITPLALTTDADAIGFALGFDPGDTTNPAADYFVAIWEGLDAGQAGLVLCRVQGVPVNGNSIRTCASPYQMEAAINLGAATWVHGVQYSFDVQFSASTLEISVDGILEFDLVPADFGSSTFDSGGFAFFNFSQAQTRYQDLTIVPEPTSALLLLIGLAGVAVRHRSG